MGPSDYVSARVVGMPENFLGPCVKLVESCVFLLIEAEVEEGLAEYHLKAKLVLVFWRCRD